MEGLISSIVILIISVGIIVMLKDKISQCDILIKIGVFSIIVAILGNILSKFIYAGFLIQALAVTCTIMCAVLKVYGLLFKTINSITIKTGMFSLFLFILFNILGNNQYIISISYKFTELISIGKIVSISCVLVCILIEVYNIIFSKDKRTYKEEIEE
ncbi:hypothetical protein [Paraclostridium bifermentans]|uniref:hypothetical protein n=1 Tax=Paraclostridium bifermentans TaxID=1490 RepID=UPI000468999A|nr:hypothetical protein [Paraclostridium bifermentans]